MRTDRDRDLLAHARREIDRQARDHPEHDRRSIGLRVLVCQDGQAIVRRDGAHQGTGLQAGVRRITAHRITAPPITIGAGIIIIHTGAGISRLWLLDRRWSM